MASQAVMLPEIELEALHFFDRTALEGLQIHSRYLRSLVNRHARTLPLRCIHEVWVRTSHVYRSSEKAVRSGRRDIGRKFVGKLWVSDFGFFYFWLG